MASCEEVRRQHLAARAEQMEIEERLRRIWGTERTMLSMKILTGLIGLVYVLQFTMSGINGGSVFSNVMGNAIFLPCVCIVGVVAAFMIHVDQCSWKLVIGVLFHCLCSASTSAYVFLVFFTVKGIRNIHDAPKDDFTNTVATIIWGMLCLIYMAISFIFLCFTYVSLHDLFSKIFSSRQEVYPQESFRVEGTEGGRIFIREVKYIHGSSSSPYHYQPL